jgi:hypothetical protein
MTLQEIADRIDAHLRRFESDPKINVVDPTYKTKRYYCVGARRAGSYVSVCYVSYQGSRNITKADAEKYLAWLDACNVGPHYESLR